MVNYADPQHGSTRAISHHQQHNGFLGDVEWKTSGHVEPADSYASASQIRQTNAVETSVAFKATYCLYGRSSNNRSCDQVWAPLMQQGVTGSLVAMKNDNGIGGEPGGGWSFANTAAGGHQGTLAAPQGPASRSPSATGSPPPTSRPLYCRLQPSA